MANYNNEGQNNTQKANFRAIIRYTEGGYFGDHDIFGQLAGMTTKGRDTAAIGEAHDATIFVMSKDDLLKIKA